MGSVNTLKSYAERIECVRRTALSTEEENMEISRAELAPVFVVKVSYKCYLKGIKML